MARLQGGDERVLAAMAAGTLLPSGPALIETVAREAAVLRSARLAGLGLLVRHRGLDASGLDRAIACLRGLSPADRQRLLAGPAFRIWLRRAAELCADEAATAADLGEHLAVLDSAVGDALARGIQRLPGAIPVRRSHVHPLLAAAAPPTYDFVRQRTATPYGLSLFTAAARLALERIATAWPELGRLFPTLVRMVVHLPDAAFRSASAARFAGAVFLGADDESVLAFEESLVHEWGHQVLYVAMELDPLVTEGEAGAYRLPWSGAERDWYGFVHAFFIYVLLANYLARRLRAATGDDRDHVASRLDEVRAGLTEAEADIVGAPRLTQTGRSLLTNVCAAAHAIRPPPALARA